MRVEVFRVGQSVARHYLRAMKISCPIFLLAFIVSTALGARATSIVILRSPHGTKIVVAADSQFSMDSAQPVNACKIIQIEKNYWTAVSGLTYESQTMFNAYQIALDAAAKHNGSIDEIAAEVRDETMRLLPAALVHRRKTIGKEAFWQEYKDGKDAHEEAFWGYEKGSLRLVYIRYVLHRRRFGGLSLLPETHACPGDACLDQRSGFGAFMGQHKIIDKFTVENADWAMKTDLESRARQFIQLEIEGEPDCHCSPPISVLTLEKSGTARWAGNSGPYCQAPK